MNTLLAKLGVAGTTSVVVTEAVQLDALYSALITLAISIVSVLAVEGVEWLKSFIKRKIADNKKAEENKVSKTEDEEVVEVVEAIEDEKED